MDTLQEKTLTHESDEVASVFQDLVTDVNDHVTGFNIGGIAQVSPDYKPSQEILGKFSALKITPEQLGQSIIDNPPSVTVKNNETGEVKVLKPEIKVEPPTEEEKNYSKENRKIRPEYDGDGLVESIADSLESYVIYPKVQDSFPETQQGHKNERRPWETTVAKALAQLPHEYRDQLTKVYGDTKLSSGRMNSVTAIENMVGIVPKELTDRAKALRNEAVKRNKGLSQATSDTLATAASQLARDTLDVLTIPNK